VNATGHEIGDVPLLACGEARPGAAPKPGGGPPQRGRILRLWLGVLASVFGGVPHAHAAGGHHAVDDALILEPGQCQLESWVDWQAGDDRRLIHLGTSCRVGPFEPGLNLDRARTGNGSVTVIGPQLKWARALSDAWSVGAVVVTSWKDANPHHVGTSLVIPLTWQSTRALRIHANVGRDFWRGERDTKRAGAAVEWAPFETWWFVVERFREVDINFWRAGARYAVSPALSVDLSRTNGSGQAAGWWTLGVNWAFDR
jgi:hypothetical protein